MAQDMFRKFLRAKLHRATVTSVDLDYEGSIGIDSALLEAAGIMPGEAVQVWNVNNGERFETYAITAPAGSGEVSLNGAAARLAHAGDTLIIACFCWVSAEAAEQHRPAVILLDSANRIAQKR
jgi:aspartate 1-decarboxylase